MMNTHHWRVLLTSIILSTLFHTGWAQHIDDTKLNAYFDTLEAHDKFMGSVAVAKDGAIIYTRAIGFADIENSQKADENTKYRIGSISKTFTAVLVLKAVEEKKISLDQSIDRYFPSIENASEITVQQLLQHRSGIHNFTDNPDYLTWNTRSKTEQELVDIIAGGGSDFQPGSKAAYSNSNFVLLTYMLEKVYGKPYADLLQEYIIAPLGLTNTRFGGKIEPGNNEAKSYRFVNGWKPENETDMSIPLGAGAIVSTPGDLALFSTALFNGQLLAPESLDRMKTIVDGFGMGLIQIPFYDRTGYGHTGGIDGFRSVFSYFTDGNISYALTCNGTAMDNNAISIAVLSAVFGKPFDIPVFSSYRTTPDQLETYVGVYASEAVPLKLTVMTDGGTLMAQATGQSAFPLEATAEDIFKFDPAGVVLEFDPAAHTVLLKQNGAQFLFTKE